MKSYRMKFPFIFIGLLFCFFFPGFTSGQFTPEKIGFVEVKLQNNYCGELRYYYSKSKTKDKKPLLIYLDGSGSYPLFQHTARGMGSTVPFDFRKAMDKFHILLISKPGIPFADSVGTDPDSGYPVYAEPEEYTKRLSLNWRVQAAQAALNDALKKLNVDSKKIAVLGVSEGFQVGAKLISVNKKITHAVLLVGNGFTQFFDFIIQNRQDALNGKISLAECQRNIDSLRVVFKDITDNPNSTEKFWYGHSYLRWSSFCAEEPFELLDKANIPIYIVGAASDQNTSVLGLDYIALRSLLRNHKNLEYHPLPYDHAFNEYRKGDEGEILEVKSHMVEVVDGAIQWLLNKN